MLVLLLWLGPAAQPAAAVPDAAPAPRPAEPLAPVLWPRIAAAALTLASEEADHAFLPVTREEALSPDYEPPDLVPVPALGVPGGSGERVRALVVPDLQEMVAAARQDGVTLWVTSGHRSYATQATVHRSLVSRLGEETASRLSAPPGHSQHQLGTAIDFNLGQPATSAAARAWLWAHAHQYGFVFPYTAASSARTGYAPEPWHVRWVGRDLAQLMWEEGYQESEDLVADDYVALARAALLAARALGPA